MQTRHPCCTFVFITIASIYNFVSMKKRYALAKRKRTHSESVAQYWILNSKPSASHQLRSIAYETLQKLIADDCFTVDPNGAIFVRVRIAESIVREFPASFYMTPEAREYIDANPNWRDGMTTSVSVQ